MNYEHIFQLNGKITPNKQRLLMIIDRIKIDREHFNEFQFSKSHIP
jgi:hypothetical protein